MILCSFNHHLNGIFYQTQERRTVLHQLLVEARELSMKTKAARWTLWSLLGVISVGTDIVTLSSRLGTVLCIAQASFNYLCTSGFHVFPLSSLPALCIYYFFLLHHKLLKPRSNTDFSSAIPIAQWGSCAQSPLLSFLSCGWFPSCLAGSLSDFLEKPGVIHLATTTCIPWATQVLKLSGLSFLISK